MRYFLDTEFMESGHKRPVHLIGVGIKCEDGRKFYAEDVDAPLHLANDWVKENVIPQLHHSHARPRWKIATEILEFVGQDAPSFWAYYADYDWTVFCQIFGTMVDLPTKWPMYCLDLKQVAVMLGVSELPEQKRTEHNALNDADWNHEVWSALNEVWREKMGVDLP